MRSLQADGDLNGHKYSVVTSTYADAIHILVHKDEKIARMFRCQLYPQPGGVIAENGLVAGLNPEPLLGGMDDTAGHLYTEIIGSMILKQNAEESRTLILGLGNIGPRSNAEISAAYREELLFVVKLVQETQQCWAS